MVLIKPRDDDELEKIHNTIEQMNNKMLQSSEEMDKTIMEIAEDKKESVFHKKK